MKLSLIFVILLYACNNPQKQAVKQPSDREIDSLLEVQKAKFVPEKEVFKDTIGLADAPVKIISAKLIEDEYTSTRDLKITYKNVSDKDIEGIRFHWMTKGVWEIEDVGRYSSLRTSEILRKNKVQSFTWNINSNNKQIYLCWPHEVVFSDGTRWKLGNK